MLERRWNEGKFYVLKGILMKVQQEYNNSSGGGQGIVGAKLVVFPGEFVWCE